MKYSRLLLILVLTLWISCSEDQRFGNLSSGPCDTLRIVDSIGVMYGDSNYIFGSISDVAWDKQGSLYVLDRKRNCILVYSPMGEFIQQIGRYGHGPGEFNDPSQIVITGDGTICVANNNQWCRFSSELEYLDTKHLDNQSIMRMESFGDDSIVGIVNILEFVNSGLSLGRRIFMWNEFDPDHYLNVYHQADHTANVPDELFTIDLYHHVKFTVIENIIYVAPEPLTEPLIISYNGNGTPQDTLLLSYPVVPKTDEDIAQEKDFVEGLVYSASSGERSIEWEPYPNRAMIGELGTDSLGRLWVQRAFDNIAAFDIIDPVRLEIVETVVIPEIDDVMNWDFYISEYDVLCVQKYEYDYPVMYIIQ